MMAPSGAVRLVVLAGGVLLFAACVHVRVGSGAQDAADRRSEITAMMANSARSWNRGDLDAFLEDYAPGDAPTFVTPRTLLRGRTAIRGVYAARFAPGAVRDSLSFELQDVDVIDADVTHVIATYILARRLTDGRDSVTSKGPTSLLMRRIDGRWRIVHDHSS